MSFKRYTSIENGYRTKHINDFFEAFPLARDERFAIMEKVDGCLDKSTLIDTKEYGKIPIKILCDNDIKCEVLSFNIETQELEYDKIIKTQISNDKKQWYLLELSDGTSLKVTGNHPIYCPTSKSFVRVDEMSVGDSVMKN